MIRPRRHLSASRRRLWRSPLSFGNTTFIRENGAASGVGVLATYQYDSLSRRSSVTFGNGVVQGFTYDPITRLATQTNDLASTASDLTQTFTYNPASQIASVTRSNDLYAWTGHTNDNLGSTPNGLNQIGNVGAKTVTHDTKGNITGVGTDSYGYASENFLTTGPGSAALSYDPMGRLSQVTQGASTTRLGYDGLDRVAEYDAANAVQRRYIHGPGVDNPISWYEGSGTTTRRFLSSDERGSVIAVTDSAGAVLGLNKYDEFGVPQSTNLGKFGYTGQAWVPEVGLWYYKARFLRPDVGRFMQTDPIGYEGDGLNLYAYVLNDPVYGIDPLGLDAVLVGIDPCQGNCTGTLTWTDDEIVFSIPRSDQNIGLEDFQKMTSAGQAFLLMTRAYNSIDFSRIANALDRFAEKRLKPPPGRQNEESYSECMQRVAGDGSLAAGGATAVASGANIVPYPRVVSGGSGTSIISTLTRGFLSDVPRMSRQIAGTASVGGAIGRVLSIGSVYGGAAAIGYDAGRAIGAAQVCAR